MEGVIAASRFLIHPLVQDLSTELRCEAAGRNLLSYDSAVRQRLNFLFPRAEAVAHGLAGTLKDQRRSQLLPVLRL